MAKYKTKRELIQIKDDEKINEGAGEGIWCKKCSYKEPLTYPNPF